MMGQRLEATKYNMPLPTLKSRREGRGSMSHSATLRKPAHAVRVTVSCPVPACMHASRALLTTSGAFIQPLLCTRGALTPALTSPATRGAHPA
jgi:hypothetical protein